MVALWYVIIVFQAPARYFSGGLNVELPMIVSNMALESVVLVTQLMRDFEAPWFVLGGWAIDLFLDAQTRSHSDIEIGIFRKDQNLLRAYLRDYSFGKVNDGVVQPWLEGESLSLPVHELYAKSDHHPIGELEVLLQEEVNGDWAFRRDLRIKADCKNILLLSKDAIPFLSPEIILLFKAKKTRAKDHSDFVVAHEKLNIDQKHWLRSAIELCQPGHEWLNHL